MPVKQKKEEKEVSLKELQKLGKEMNEIGFDPPINVQNDYDDLRHDILVNAADLLEDDTESISDKCKLTLEALGVGPWLSEDAYVDVPEEEADEEEADEEEADEEEADEEEADEEEADEEEADEEEADEEEADEEEADEEEADEEEADEEEADEEEADEEEADEEEAVPAVKKTKKSKGGVKKMPAKKEKPKAKGAVKKTKTAPVKKDNKEKTKFGHVIGTQGAKIDELLSKGDMTRDKIAKAIKVTPARVKAHMNQLVVNGYTVKEDKNGNLKAI